MRHPTEWGVIFVLGGTLLLAGCASQSYKHFVKPIADDLHSVGHKLGKISDHLRDPTCTTAECEWQHGAFGNE